MINAEFYIFKDEYGIVEFREKKADIYKLSFAAILGGILLIYISAIHAESANCEYVKLINYFLFDSLGLIFLAFGITSLFFRRYIIVNKIKNEMLVVLGIRRYLRWPKKYHCHRSVIWRSNQK